MRAAKLLNDDPETPLNAVFEPEAMDWPKATEHHLVDGGIDPAVTHVAQASPAR